MQARETGSLMFDLKTNLRVLEEALSHVKERYDSDLCQFLRMTLRRAYEQRPYVTQLLELPYVQRCLELNGSSLYIPPASELQYSETCLKDHLYPETTSLQRPRGWVPKVTLLLILTFIQRPPVLRGHFFRAHTWSLNFSL